MKFYKFQNWYYIIVNNKSYYEIYGGFRSTLRKGSIREAPQVYKDAFEISLLWIQLHQPNILIHIERIKNGTTSNSI